MAVWFSGDLWKLNSTGRDPTDLMNWRRRYFTLVWDESLGLVLNYASEKEDCKQTLGCIIQGKGGSCKASLATLQTVDVKLDDTDIQSYENSIRTYDIAVHKRSLHDPCDMSVPTDMKQIMVNGVDQDGGIKILILGWSATDAMASWLNVIENAVRHHFKVELVVEHMQATIVDPSLLGFAGTDSMAIGESLPVSGIATEDQTDSMTDSMPLGESMPAGGSERRSKEHRDLRRADAAARACMAGGLAEGRGEPSPDTP